MANYHVTPNPKGWSIKKENASRSSGNAPTQRAAEKIAKGFARSSGGGEVVIHRRDGRIRDKDTMAPAKDPYPPKG